MVIKGKSVAGASRLAAHLERLDTNERMEVIELRDVAAADLHGALREMEAVASACPNCKKPFYHASINTRADERLTPEQRMELIDRLEKELGLTGQPRAVVVHEKEGREHCHVVWSRIDLEKMRTISDSHNYRTHELVARGLEREFGHERVQGAHIERDGQERPERTPSHKEMQQAARTGVSPKEAQELIAGVWRSTDSGRAFQAGLEDKGWLLARGDRRDFVAVDPKGGAHSLSRRIEGATAKDVRARLADLDPRRLPSVAEAKNLQQERQAAREPPRAAAAPSRTHEAPAASKGRPDKREGVRVAAGVLGGIGKALDGAAAAAEALIDGLFGGGTSAAKGVELDKQPLDAGPVPPPAEREEAIHREEETRSARRQSLLREYGREVPQEIERDVEIERDRRGRERER